MLRRIAVVLAATAVVAAVGTPLVTSRADARPNTAGVTGNMPSSQDCGERHLHQPFAAMGDTNKYYLPLGGDFENAATGNGWFGAGVTQAGQNEPWQVGGPEDDKSIVLDRAGATLSAPLLCVKDDEPTIRFFYKSPGTPGAKLAVNMRTTSPAGASNKSITLDGSTPGWKVSPPLTIDNNTDRSGTQNLYLDFQSQGGAWVLDDVYVDPWKYVIK